MPPDAPTAYRNLVESNPTKAPEPSIHELLAELEAAEEEYHRLTAALRPASDRCVNAVKALDRRVGIRLDRKPVGVLLGGRLFVLRRVTAREVNGFWDTYETVPVEMA